MLDIILRTCAATSAPTFSPISVRRICGDDRGEMILKCLYSLAESINFSDHDIRLTVLDDHSGEAFLKKMQVILAQCDKPYELVSLEQKGFNASAYQQFLLARNARELVYTVEDDYLHAKDAIKSMIYAYYRFKSHVGFNEVALYPFDCNHRYDVKRGGAQPCRIFYEGGRYWRTVTESANTIFSHRDVFARFSSVFDSLALEYPNKDEGVTINRLYNNLVYSGGPVTLFSPIPSVAVHLTYEEPLAVITEMFDWRNRWNSIDLNEKI